MPWPTECRCTWTNCSGSLRGASWMPGGTFDGWWLFLYRSRQPSVLKIPTAFAVMLLCCMPSCCQLSVVRCHDVHWCVLRGWGGICLGGILGDVLSYSEDCYPLEVVIDPLNVSNSWHILLRNLLDNHIIVICISWQVRVRSAPLFWIIEHPNLMVSKHLQPVKAFTLCVWYTGMSASFWVVVPCHLDSVPGSSRPQLSAKCLCTQLF